METENPDTQDLIIRMREKLCLRTLDRSVRLAAVIFADKVPHKPTTIDMLKKAWASFGEVGITARDERDPTDRLFAVTVRNEEAAKDIMENSPWSVKGYSVHIQPWPEHLAIEELPTNNIVVWIQMRGVPPYMFSVRNVEEMVEHFGVFIKMDDPLESGDGTYCFLRVRVMLDARRPLPTGFTLPRDDGSPSWVEFKFERLSRFCFCCGRLGHIETMQTPCPNSEEPRPEGIVYGEWMITSAFRRPGQATQVTRPAGRRRSAGQRITPENTLEIGQSPQTKNSQRMSSPNHSQLIREGRNSDLTTWNPSVVQSEQHPSLGPHNGQEPVNHQHQQRYSLPLPNPLHQNNRPNNHSITTQHLSSNAQGFVGLDSQNSQVPMFSHVQTPISSVGPSNITTPPYNGNMSNTTPPQDLNYMANLTSSTLERVISPNEPRYLHHPIESIHPNSNPTTFLSKRPMFVETSEPATQKKPKTSPKPRHFVKTGSKNKTNGQHSGSGVSLDNESVGGDLLQGGGGWPTATRPQ
ncbi:hypothetical protein ABKV19_026549 [Rosa sericea]